MKRLTMGVVTLLSVFMLAGCSQSNKNSSAKSSSSQKTESKSDQATNKRNQVSADSYDSGQEANQVYSVKVTSVKETSKKNNDSWIIKGTTDAPDGSRVVGFVAPGEEKFDSEGFGNVANEHNGRKMSVVDDHVPVVNNGKFNMSVSPMGVFTPDQYRTTGSKGHIIIAAVENSDASWKEFINTKLFNKIREKAVTQALTISKAQSDYENSTSDPRDDKTYEHVDADVFDKNYKKYVGKKVEVQVIIYRLEQDDGEWILTTTNKNQSIDIAVGASKSVMNARDGGRIEQGSLITVRGKASKEYYSGDDPIAGIDAKAIRVDERQLYNPNS